MSTFTPQATLIIPTLERPEQVQKLLQELQTQKVQNFETLIIDQSDQPNQEASRQAQASNGKFRYFHLERKSLPNARNVAAHHARSEHLIFIDDDVELAQDFVQHHLQHLQKPQIDAVAGRITGGYDDAFDNLKAVGKVNLWTGKVQRNFHCQEFLTSIEQLPGGNFSVQRKLYHELKGFDANGFGGPASIGEESDFSFRLRKAGKTIVFEPKAALVHLHLPRGGCRDPSVLRWTYWHGHNTALLQRRYAPIYTWPVFLTMQILRYAGHSIRKRNPFLWPVGLAGTIKGFLRGQYKG